jgi:hypothetical protein
LHSGYNPIQFVDSRRRMKNIDVGQTIQILANVGVIAGIAFLAIQISQNTAQTRAEAYQSRALAMAAIQSSMAQAPNDVADLFARTDSSNPGYADEIEGLSAADLYRLRMSANALMRVLDNNLFQCELGYMDDEFCRLIDEDVRALLPWFESVLGGEMPPALYRLRAVE